MKIPENLDEAIKSLKISASAEELEKFKQSNCEYDHHGIGRGLRNSWGLWSGSPLKSYFNSIGVVHADDMSAIIFRSLWRDLNDLPIDLEGQVAYYKRYWEGASEGHWEEEKCHS